MIKKNILILMVFILVNCNSKIVSERKTILIRCDDIGMCHGVNLAAKRLLDTKIPFSASVMACCPWFTDAVELLKDQSQVSIGVHLTLNSEWKNYRWGPISGIKSVPSLVDEQGYFFPSRSLFFENNPKTTEVELELRTQLDRAINSGLKIDYVDYHMGTAVSTSEFVEVVEKLAQEYKLGISRWYGEKDMVGVYSILPENKLDTLLQEIQSLNINDINLLVCHIGSTTPEMNSMKDMNKFGLENMSRHRESEANVLCSSELINLIDNKIVKPITYKDLKKKIGLKNMARPKSFNY